MKPIKIFTDTCSDITEEVRNKYDIVSIDFTIFYKGKELNADPWVEVSPAELYGTLKSGERVYTLPATEYEIRAKFKKYVKDFDIIYVAACEKQSTTIVKARRIASELMEKNNDYRIEIIDSLNASIGQMLVTLKACELRDQNLTVEEIVENTLPIRNNILQFATVDTLTYLSMANKINARSAALGNYLDLKPILISDVEGRQIAMSRVKGKEKSLDEIVRLFKENVVDPENQEVTIIHGYDLKTARVVEKKLIQAGLKCKKINIFCVGPVVGITTGPGMVGIFGFGKNVTYKGE